MRYNNFGYVLVVINSVMERLFVLKFFVIEVMFFKGLEVGGLVIYIMGFGFFMDKDFVFVIIGGYFCDVMIVNYNRIVCRIS